jgi:hypothetical protein
MAEEIDITRRAVRQVIELGMDDGATMQRHIFIDHSNIWGGARLATRILDPTKNEADARLSIKRLNRVLGGTSANVATRIVSGGIPPGMETVWTEYRSCGYDKQRLIRDSNHIIIRQVKYLNNIVEQDHQAIKRVTRPMLGFKSFHAAHGTLVGIELMHMLKKGQLVVEEGTEDLTAAELFYTLAT